MEVRLDVALVRLGLASSRSKAQELIENGCVEVSYQEKPQTSIVASMRIDLEKVQQGLLKLHVDSSWTRFVSRGGLKLDGALEFVKLDVANWMCLDCGQSTGGFTDCLLSRGAKKVVGFDVGRGQLHPKLQQDPRVQSFEGLHFYNLMNEPVFLNARPPAGFDLLVADLSFISIEKVAPLFSMLSARALLLVKPQFELGAQALGRQGVVKDPKLYEGLEVHLRTLMSDLGWTVLHYFLSPLQGKDGNYEFFMYAEHSGVAQCRS